jgi:23S rRNA pseudouridine2605 synthase
MHPRYGVTKSYRVRLAGRIDDEALQKVRDGVRLAEGRTAGARILVERRTDRFSDLIVVLNEGKNREVRRIFAQVGFKVSRLHRERIGTLDDRGLKLGAWRPLARAEIDSLLDPNPPQNRGLPGRPRSRKSHGTHAGSRPSARPFARGKGQGGARQASRPGWAPGGGPRPTGGGRARGRS